ncbi:MAG TPA: methyltransferase domain-containing protein [Pyrinomonadaceae bacterium]|jgi:predicted SAM-dependent methyltransferase
MKCLNLGCGSRFNPAWTNVDFAATNPTVLSHNLRQGIPFPDEEFDVVYHSHLLEHFSRPDTRAFLRECWRVLKAGGTIRIAVPDLERIAKTYLEKLEQATTGDEQRAHDYEWMMLELYDQTVRESTGGEMAAYLSREGLPNQDFVIDRIGLEAKQLIESAERPGTGPASRAEDAPAIPRRMMFRQLRRILKDRVARRETIVRRLLGSEYELLELGRFRRSGEVHLWMYDRYSLARTLAETGFHGIEIVRPDESRIPDWSSYHLDTEPDGSVCKPDSLFMEASR